jgi:hypothetical protein
MLQCVVSNAPLARANSSVPSLETEFGIRAKLGGRVANTIFLRMARRYLVLPADNSAVAACRSGLGPVRISSRRRFPNWSGQRPDLRHARTS